MTHCALSVSIRIIRHFQLPKATVGNNNTHSKAALESACRRTDPAIQKMSRIVSARHRQRHPHPHCLQPVPTGIEAGFGAHSESTAVAPSVGLEKYSHAPRR